MIFVCFWEVPYQTVGMDNFNNYTPIAVAVDTFRGLLLNIVGSVVKANHKHLKDTRDALANQI